MDSEKELELLNAAQKGIEEYLRSTRGAHIFGANSSVRVDAESEHIYIDHKAGRYVIFIGLRL